MRRRHGEEGVKSEEFKRFEEAVRHLLTVPKSELKARLAEYNATKPHKRGRRPNSSQDSSRAKDA